MPFDADAFDAIVARIEENIAERARADLVPEVDWEAATRAVIRTDRSVRELRASVRILAGVSGEVGLAREIAQVTDALKVTTQSNRELKRRFREISDKRTLSTKERRA